MEPHDRPDPATGTAGIVAWMREARATWTPEAIDARLDAMGYGRAEIEAARSQLAAEDRAVGVADRRRVATAVLVVAYVGFWVAYLAGWAVGDAPYYYFPQVPIAVLGLLLGAVLVATVSRFRRSRRLAVATSASMLVALVPPFVLLVGIGGLCLVVYPPR